jgi:hypothetical protein
MLQPSSARALEGSIRSWVHLHVTEPGSLPEPHQQLMYMQRLAMTCTGPEEAYAAPPAAAAAQLPGLTTSSESFALSVTCLKAAMLAAAEKVEPDAGSGFGASSSSGRRSTFASHRCVVALMHVMLTAVAAKTACSSFNSLAGSSSSSKALMLPAWQLLLAHCLHAAGRLLLSLHADGVLPAPSQQHTRQLEARMLLGNLRAALEAVPAQLATTVLQPAAAAQEPAQKVDPCTSLLQQHEILCSKIQQLTVTAADSSTWHNESTSNNSSVDCLLGLKALVSAELAQQLVDFGAALSGCFPAKLCCNAPNCGGLHKFSELEAVGGKSCMCARCKTARCVGCQVATVLQMRLLCAAVLRLINQ